VEHGMQIHNDRVKTLDDILAKNEPYMISQLDISGEDLKAIGIPSGPVMGKVLRELLNLVIQAPQKNNKQFLKQWARNNWIRLEKEINTRGSGDDEV